MCLGGELDTMAKRECAALGEWAAEEFACHSFEVRTNTDGVAWVVLEPPSTRIELLRFTICRIVPCILVMVEDADARRQFCSSGRSTISPASPTPRSRAKAGLNSRTTGTSRLGSRA